MKGQKSTYCEYCGDFHDSFHEYPSSVKVGEAIPDYEFEAVQEGKVKTVKFSDFRGSWLVIVFYPADWSGVCTSELDDLAGRYAEFKALGAEVVTISTDSVHVHRAWQAQSEAMRNAPFTMGADPSGKIALAFGVLVEGGDIQFLPGEGMAQRGTFVVDPKGVLRTMEVHDLEMARSSAETLRKLKAAQYIDTAAGNVCPAGWDGE